MNNSMSCVGGVLLMFPGATHAEDHFQGVQVMHAYEDAWSRHDARAIAGFYCEPALRVSKDGPAVRETRAAQEGFFGSFLPSLVSNGYDHSAWDRLEVRLLDANTAIAIARCGRPLSPRRQPIRAPGRRIGPVAHRSGLEDFLLCNA